MEFETIRLETEGQRARVILNRAGRGNAINVKMVEELQAAFHRIEDANEVRVVVLAAAGPDFCRGIDLTDFSRERIPDIHGFSRWEKVCRSLERLPAVTIAATDGEVAGGGLQLALACDVRVATSRSFFHFHDVRMGFIPGMGTYRLAKFIGLGRARRMALTGRKVQAEEAQRIGLIDHLCGAGDLESSVAAAIDEFGPIHPEAVELIRRLVDESYENPWEDFLGNFLAAQDRAIRSKDFRDHVARAHEEAGKK
jgi:enoyl-CoA hydratase/carnithine racemase